jgi:phosphatidylserine decarboxylase
VNASFDKASSDNERNALVLRMADGTEISCVQVAGLIARRILCYVKAGDTLKRGQRYGFIRFGSRVDVYLPMGSKPRVAIGDKVSASSTILAELPGKT